MVDKDSCSIVQDCFIDEDVLGIPKHHLLNVKSLHKVLTILMENGYEDYGVSFGYDCNCAFTGAYNKFEIHSKTIRFTE